MHDVAQEPIELILFRHLAEHLAVPIFEVDADGNLVFFNEAAEELLGTRYDDVGEMSLAEWTAGFAPRDAAGRPMTADELPPLVALRDGRPVHVTMVITGRDGVHREIGVTAFPLTAGNGQQLGAVGMFWEAPGR